MATRRAFTKGLFAAGLATRAHGQATNASTGAGSLRAAASAHGHRFGAAVNVKRLQREPAYAQTVAEQCNILVAENAMKWAALRPAVDRYDFSEADTLVAFAEAHGIAVRGHNLCWHEALPAWFAGAVTPANAETVLREHIGRVVGHYKNRVTAWDVVNEAVEPKDGRPDGLRKTPWLDLLGPRYLEIAFEAARAADPGAKLFYNEYGLELDEARRASTLALVGRLGHRVDGVGLQSHLSADSAGKIGAGLTAFVRALGMRKLTAAVTELDVNDDALPGEGRDEAVAGVYRRYLGPLLREPNVNDVLCWGVNDGSSWLNSPGKAKLRPKHPERQEHCLLFDDAFQPLSAYYAVRDMLNAFSPTCEITPCSLTGTPRSQ